MPRCFYFEARNRISCLTMVGTSCTKQKASSSATGNLFDLVLRTTWAPAARAALQRGDSVSYSFRQLPTSNWHEISWINCFFFFSSVFMLYLAWKRGLPRKCARFVPFRPIKKRSFHLSYVLNPWRSFNPANYYSWNSTHKVEIKTTRRGILK